MMARFEPVSSGGGSDHSANCALTVPVYLSKKIPSYLTCSRFVELTSYAIAVHRITIIKGLLKSCRCGYIQDFYSSASKL